MSRILVVDQKHFLRNLNKPQPRKRDPRHKLGIYTKSVRGGNYVCQECPEPIQPKQKYFEWSMGGQLVRCHLHHDTDKNMFMRLNHTDGGRASAGFSQERNDCTVRALVEATGISYADAHAYMARNGRKNGRGAKFIECVYELFCMNGVKLKYHATHCQVRYNVSEDKIIKIWNGPRTLGQFLATADINKKYIANLHGHVVAVVNKKMADSFQPGMRSLLGGYWEVVNA